MSTEILSVAQSQAADAHAVQNGTPFLELMENAGRAVAMEVIKNYTQSKVLVLCGPGNNGGDGWVAARILKQYDWPVRVARWGAPATDAARHMADQWDGASEDLHVTSFDDADIVIDALFGAGLSRPLEPALHDIVRVLNASAIPVVAVDVPSGIHGDLGRGLDHVWVEAQRTISFFRKKPAHLLLPARQACGSITIMDIGIPDTALAPTYARLRENSPALWGGHFPWPRADSHKYSRGHCIVISGPADATGAARLAARAALRAGAGVVSVASPPEAALVNAINLTAVMVKIFDGPDQFAQMFTDSRINTVVIGPGTGLGEITRQMVETALASPAACVLDADALSSFKNAPHALFALLRPRDILTPHAGEFERLFPGLLAQCATKLDAAIRAADQSGCTILLKGGDTVIASPDGRATITANAPPTLATAGSGDVLAGLIAGFLAQHVPGFEAAAMGAWLHGEAANHFGPGLIAEDLPEQLPEVLAQLQEMQRSMDCG